MTLKSYGGKKIVEMAERASRKQNISKVSKDFYKTLYEAFKKEQNKKRSPGDRHALRSCIAEAMNSLIQHLVEIDKNIKEITYKIEVPGLPRGKFPDYALQKGNKVYLIEQKSILQFNEFSQVFYEALLARQFKGSKRIYFAGLFNYLHQEREPFEMLCKFERKKIIHHLCVLIPEKEYTEYSTDEVDKLFNSIKNWLV